MKSLSKTPSPKKDRIYGSKVNPKGSASSEKSAKSIKFNPKTIASLTTKLNEFKETHNTKKVSLSDLKAVYRRGLGAYSSSHRPTISGGKPNSRNAWAMARVNAFLRKASGGESKKAYVQDDDLLKYHLGGDMSKHLAPNGKPSNLTHEQWHLVRTPEFKAWFGNWENNPEDASKVVDENGEPLVVYRGNIEKMGYEFTLSHNLLKKPTINNFGHFFTPNKFVAKRYAQNFARKMIGFYKGKPNYDLVLEEGYILDVFLNAKKILDLTPLGEFAEGYTFVDYLISKKLKFKGYQKLINEIRKYRYYEHNEQPFIYGFFDIFPKLRDLFIANNINGIKFLELSRGGGITFVVFESTQIKLADGTNTTFDSSNPDIRYADGGEVEDKKKTYEKWKSLVNMSYGEVKKFYDSKEGKEAGLSQSEANKQGISNGRESARWVMKMKTTPKSEWTPTMWKWANKQISFISRMSGNQGDLYDDKGNKTRKHTSLLIWGHNPKKSSSMKFKEGGETDEQYFIAICNYVGFLPNSKDYYTEKHHRLSDAFDTLFDFMKSEEGLSYMPREGCFFSIERLYYKGNEQINKVMYKIIGKEALKLHNKGMLEDGGIMDVRMEDTVQRMDDPNFADISMYENGGATNDDFDSYESVFNKWLSSDLDLEFFSKGASNDQPKEMIERRQKISEQAMQNKKELDELIEKLQKQGYNTSKMWRDMYNKDKLNDKSSYKTNMADGGVADVRMEDTIKRMDDPNFADISMYKDGGTIVGLTSTQIDTMIHNVSRKFKLPLEYIKQQFHKGVKVEMEHTSDKSVASKIALDHLNESPYYYQKLEEMEKELDAMNMDADSYLPRVMSAYANGGSIDMIYKLNTPTKEPTKLNYIQQVLVRTKQFKEWFGDWETCAMNFLADGKNNFKKHYENCSKVIDLITLEPQVEYHGTNFSEEFYEFDVTHKEGQGRPYGYFADNIEYSQNFTTNSQRGKSGLALLYNCFINIRNPFMAIDDYFYGEQGETPDWIIKIARVLANDKYDGNWTPDQFVGMTKIVVEQIGDYLINTFSSSAPFWMAMSKDKNKEFKYFLLSHGYDGVRYAEEIAFRYDIDNPSQFTKAWTIFNSNQVKLADGRNIDFDPFNKDIRYEEGGSTQETKGEQNMEAQQRHYTKSETLRQNLGLEAHQKFAEGGHVQGDGVATDDAKKGGYFKGRSHADGGIKAINKDTGQLLEVEGNEVIINKRSVADNKKREFEGKMMTNREILSKINEEGGGVAFKDGGEINEKSCACRGKRYKFGGELVSDYDIVKQLTSVQDSIKKPINSAMSYVNGLIDRMSKM